MNGHLSDTLIQEYLDSSGQKHRETVQGHIENCGHCRAVLNNYQQLYSQLAIPPEFELPHDFASVTASKARELAAEPRPVWISDRILIAGLTLLGLGVSAFFIPWSPILQWLSTLSVSNISLQLPQNQMLNQFMSRFGRPLAMLPFAGLAAGAIAWLDHKIELSRQKKPEKLSL